MLRLKQVISDLYEIALRIVVILFKISNRSVGMKYDRGYKTSSFDLKRNRLPLTSRAPMITNLNCSIEFVSYDDDGCTHRARSVSCDHSITPAAIELDRIEVSFTLLSILDISSFKRYFFV